VVDIGLASSSSSDSSGWRGKGLVVVVGA